MVSYLTIIALGISALIGAILPIGLFIYIKRERQGTFKALLTGGATFLIFVTIIESLVHSILLSTNFKNIVNSNIFVYGLYAGFMAGLFEEVGRFVMMKLFMKKEMKNDGNALMFGVGHGGIEVIMILVFTFINYISYCFMINSGSMAQLISKSDVSIAFQLQELTNVLISTPFYVYFVSVIERVLALALHICLSCLVFKAVKNKKLFYLLLAIVLHMLIDSISVIATGFISNVFVLELIVAILTSLVILITFKICK